MITIILSTTLSILSSCNQPTSFISDPFYDSNDDANSLLGVADERLANENHFYLGESDVLNSSEYIAHYSVSTKKTTYDYIDVSDDTSMIQRTSKYGSGYSTILRRT